MLEDMIGRLKLGAVPKTHRVMAGRGPFPPFPVARPPELVPAGGRMTAGGAEIGPQLMGEKGGRRARMNRSPHCERCPG